MIANTGKKPVSFQVVYPYEFKKTFCSFTILKVTL